MYVLNRRGDLLWKERLDRTPLDIAVSDDGNLIVAGLEDGAVIAFNKRGGKAWEFRTKGAVRAVDIAPDGARVIAGGEDSVLYALSKEGDLLFRYEANETVVGARFVCQGAAIAVATNYSYVHFLNRQGDVVLLRHAPDDLWSFDANREGTQLAFATKGGHVILADNSELAALVVEDGARRIGQISAEGFQVQEAENMAKEALKQVKGNQAAKALDAIQHAERKAGELRAAGFLARADDAVRKAQAAVDKAKGFDTRKAVYLLGVARRAKAARAYESAIKFAASAQGDAEEAARSQRRIAEGDERSLPEIKVDEPAPVRGQPAPAVVEAPPAPEPEEEAEEEVAEEVAEEGEAEVEAQPEPEAQPDELAPIGPPDVEEGYDEVAAEPPAEPEDDEPVVSEPYPGVKVFEGDAHEGGRPECKGSTLKINGECAVCGTFTILKGGLDQAKQIKPKPPSEVLRSLKDAKDARDAGDFAKSWHLTNLAMDAIRAASGASPPAPSPPPQKQAAPPARAPSPPPKPAAPAPPPEDEPKKKKGFMRR